MEVKNQDIKVSICVVTFNQKDYIRECLDSLISQETDFPYEIIVGDDGSTDGTSEIVLEYGSRYPGLVLPVVHKTNVGAVANAVHLYRMARGKYIAHMDGDDFALPGKLQKQVDALERNPGCVICSHNVFVVDSLSNIVLKSFVRKPSGVYFLKDLYGRLPFFAHSSKMFLNDAQSKCYDDLPPETVDIELHVMQAKKGNIVHLDEVLGAYRQMVGVAQSGGRVNPYLPAATRRIFDAALREAIDEKERQDLLVFYARAILAYAYQSALAGKRRDCKNYCVESLRIKFFSFLQVVLLFASFFPGLAFFAALRAKLKKYFSHC